MVMYSERYTNEVFFFFSKYVSLPTATTIFVKKNNGQVEWLHKLCRIRQKRIALDNQHLLPFENV